MSVMIADTSHARLRGLRSILPSARHFFRTETVVFLTFWLLLMVGGRSRLFKDPGSLWHIVVGEQILSSGQLPHRDSFSHTCAGQPFIAQWWLGECALALFHRIGGLDGILLFTVTIQALFLTWLAYRFLRVGVHPLLAFLFTGLAFLGIAFHFHPRPHLVTILLMGWTFARLCDFEAGRASLRSLSWLVPLYVFWTNVHGGMVGGVATMALALAGWSLAQWLRWPTPLRSQRDVLLFGGLLLACALTAYVNPYSAELPQVWFALFRSPLLPTLIEEHAPLLTKYVGWFEVLLAVVYVAALLGVAPKRIRVTWLIPLVWFYLAWGRSRHGPLFAVTATLALADMVPHIRWVHWLALRGSDICRLNPAQAAARQRFGWGPVLAASVLLATGWTLQAAGVPVPVLGRGWVKLDPQQWPTELLPELQDYERTHGPGTPVFNDMLFGGFLIYHTPGLRIFIDDRCELYGDERLVTYAHALFEDPSAIEAWRQQYHFELALVVPESQFDHYLQNSKKWFAVRRTQAAVLYITHPDGGTVMAARSETVGSSD